MTDRAVSAQLIVHDYRAALKINGLGLPVVGNKTALRKLIIPIDNKSLGSEELDVVFFILRELSKVKRSGLLVEFL